MSQKRIIFLALPQGNFPDESCLINLLKCKGGTVKRTVIENVREVHATTSLWAFL